MSKIANVSVEQLKRAISIREEIESLEAKLNEILGGGGIGGLSPFTKRKRMSASGRARIAAAQKTR